MAVEFKVEGTRTSENRFLPHFIKVKPELNGRHDLPNIEWLINSILEFGQLQPVVIRNDGGTPVLCAGFSRWRAISEINKRKLTPKPLLVRCSYLKVDEMQGYLAAIAENHHRNAPTELDDAYNVQRMLNIYQMTEEQIAAVYFPPDKEGQAKDPKQALRFVKERLALIDLAPVAKKAMKEGRLKGTAARAIAKLTQEQQAEVIASKPQGKIKGSDVPTTKAPAEKGWKFIKAEIESVIESGYFQGAKKKVQASDDMVEWLQRLVG